ncbi:hypothetical protein ACWFR1_36145 [Streptomyces sp. NPDC055103]
MTTVTDDGAVGSSRDHLTFTSPIFGRRSTPSSVIEKRALVVKRMDWRLVFFLNFGGPIFGPLRVPFLEAKKLEYAVSRSRRDCWSTTADASSSQCRSSVFLASVTNRFEISAAVGRLPPCL